MGYAGAILPRKISTAALAHAPFEPDGSDRIKVTLTDLEQTLAISLVPERLQGASGRFLFPVAELKALKADTVTIQPMAEDAVVCTAASGGRSFARTVTVPPVTEFPETVQPTELAECDLGAFLRAYRGVAFAATADPSRLALHAVYADPERSALVATDGHRLTLRPLVGYPLPGNAALPLTKMLLKQFPESENGRIGLSGEARLPGPLVSASRIGGFPSHSPSRCSAVPGEGTPPERHDCQTGSGCVPRPRRAYSALRSPTTRRFPRCP